MDITPFSPGAPAAQAAQAAQATQSRSGGAITSDFDMFLKMLTAQMTNQDPLDPTNSADYAVQLATFSGVEQQVLTNDLLQALSSQMGLTQMAEMAGWVGKEARAAAPAQFSGAPLTIAPNPAAASDAVQLVVRDSSGQEVQRLPLPVSADPIEWVGTTTDGSPLPSGIYEFDVVSLFQGEEILVEPAEIYHRITEVQSRNGETLLILSGGHAVAAGNVTALRDPSS